MRKPYFILLWDKSNNNNNNNNNNNSNNNNVPSKYITVDDKNPVWINETIKSKIQAKNAF